MATGIARDAIRLVTSPTVFAECYGPGCASTVRLDVTVQNPQADQVKRLIYAAAEAARADSMSMHRVGVAYAVADCGPLQRQARKQATQNARVHAEQQAEVLGLKLGAMRMSSDVAAGNAPVTAVDGCGAGATPDDGLPYGFEFGYGGGIDIGLPPYDPTAPAEASAVVQVNLTFDVVGS